MKNIKMNTIYAGPAGICQPGGTISVEDDEAKDLVAGGYGAEVVNDDAEEGTKPKPKAKTRSRAKAGTAAPDAETAAVTGGEQRESGE